MKTKNDDDLPFDSIIVVIIIKMSSQSRVTAADCTISFNRADWSGRIEGYSNLLPPHPPELRGTEKKTEIDNKCLFVPPWFLTLRRSLVSISWRTSSDPLLALKDVKKIDVATIYKVEGAAPGRWVGTENDDSITISSSSSSPT